MTPRPSAEIARELRNGLDANDRGDVARAERLMDEAADALDRLEATFRGSEALKRGYINATELLTAELVAARAENAALRAALEPFARYADGLRTPGFPDDVPIGTMPGGRTEGRPSLGDCRRARAAMGES